MSRHKCSTCKHWNAFTGDLTGLRGDGFGKCCNYEKFVYIESSNDIPLDTLAYWDYEGYSAGFHTGKDFGCTHWLKR